MKSEDKKITVKLTCVKCGKEVEVEVYESDYVDFKNGTFVQDAFPYLSSDVREMFISGICGECYDKLFSDMEDE